MDESANDLITVSGINMLATEPNSLKVIGLSFTLTHEGKVLRYFEDLSYLTKVGVQLLKRLNIIKPTSTQERIVYCNNDISYNKRMLPEFRKCANNICEKLGYCTPTSEDHPNKITIELLYKHQDSDLVEREFLKRMVSTDATTILETWDFITERCDTLQAIPINLIPGPNTLI